MPMTSRQCEIAAESYAACLLARSGYDVLVQYGANQPHYDLVAVKGKRMLPVSVKGSQDGGWMLAVKYRKKGTTCHEAIDHWQSQQRDDLVYVFVQFIHVPLGDVPRVYVARPPEIAAHLKAQCHGHGHVSLQENTRRQAPRSQYNDEVPIPWQYSYDRIDHI
jgi:Holliday junction resolvase-like predicted endonuclease